ncbi:MAG: hypothetical protein AAGA30_18695, partial [Planctomycetota bacterium]
MLARVVDTIEKQLVHSSDQYFLVQAVKLAVAHKATLPHAWIQLASARWEQMAQEAPFGDEAKMLGRSIYVWLKRWKVKENLKIGFAERLMAKFSWPKAKWIPNEPNC